MPHFPARVPEGAHRMLRVCMKMRQGEWFSGTFIVDSLLILIMTLGIQYR